MPSWKNWPLDIAIVRVVNAVGRFFFGALAGEIGSKRIVGTKLKKPNKTGHKMARSPACCAEPLIWSVETLSLREPEVHFARKRFNVSAGL
jgi:hypothetical protein